MTLPEAIVQMKRTNRSTSRTDGASMAKPRTGRRGTVHWKERANAMPPHHHDMAASLLSISYRTGGAMPVCQLALQTRRTEQPVERLVSYASTVELLKSIEVALSLLVDVDDQ